MSKISEQKALEAYPIKITRSETETSIGEKYDANYINRQIYIQGYDKATQDIFNYLEANIPCGEMSSEDVRGFIIECKEYFK